MHQKPSPLLAPLRGASRAAGFSEELFRRTSKPKNSTSQNHRQRPIAWVSVFVSWLGNVGYWIRQCPLCGHEHVHGGYVPFDPRTRQGFARFQFNLSHAESLGWRAPHCHQPPRCGTREDDGREYELMLTAEPARFGPGAQYSRRAKRTMDYLRSIGVNTSSKTIPSAWPPSRWRWL
jgi:hypothetical protein